MSIFQKDHFAHLNVKKKSNQKMGWIPDTPDKRDLKYKVPPHIKNVELTSSQDLRNASPPIWDQGQLGSCTAHSTNYLFQFCEIKQGIDNKIQQSRLLTYYFTRLIEGSVNSDAGGQMRDAIKAIATYGSCDETLWPYSDNNKQFKKPPTTAVKAVAIKHKAVTYMRVDQTAAAMKGCLAEGFPFHIGISVYDSFMGDAAAQNGLIPMPKTDRETLQGGHAIAIVGYDDNKVDADGNKGVWICRNSWGTGWGDKGYFYMPYKYLLDSDLSDDLWTVRTVK